MKRLVVALTALAAFTAPALAADMAPRYAKAAPAAVAYAPSWTGCYIGAGGGGGVYVQDTTQYFVPPIAPAGTRIQAEAQHTLGGKGYFGTVGGGCDYQFGVGTYNFVIGAFGDYDFASIKGQWAQQNGNLTGTEKMSSAWSVGGRIGWVALPGLMTYFSAGYTEATFDQVNVSFFPASPANTNVAFFNAQTYKGWFLGAGDEYALNFLPGLFWKTEYRFSEFNKARYDLITTATGLPQGSSHDTQKFTHTVRTELVYRFNWGGAPLVAKY